MLSIFLPKLNLLHDRFQSESGRVVMGSHGVNQNHGSYLCTIYHYARICGGLLRVGRLLWITTLFSDAKTLRPVILGWMKLDQDSVSGRREWTLIPT